jgi:hypothetical protein
MKRNRRTFAGVLGMVASLGLAGCGALPDDSYAAVEDGAQRALAATFSFSAGVANWLAEPSEPSIPPCAANRRG